MGKKILAVDDEPVMVRLIQANLERNGHEVVTACDGKGALEKVETEHPDLIVLDVMMPDIDGFEVVQKLKQKPETREIPIVLLTAKSDDADKYRGWRSGCDCYLIKPLDPQELIATVDRIFKTIDEEDPVPVADALHRNVWVDLA
jgi:two-component system alkaline phosphatase synthesis response regulator PhoP